MQKLTSSDGEAIDYLGYSVALEGDTLVAGAILHPGNVPGEVGPGAAYVFVRRGGVWSEEANLFDPLGQPGDLFGHDVALQGSTLLVGAQDAEIDGDPSRGAAYVYRGSGATWTLEQKLLAEDGFESGDTSAWDQTVP